MQWLAKAHEDLNAADVNIKEKLYSYAAFLLQQSTEKALKSALIAEGKGLLRTHDCYVLAKAISSPQEVCVAAEKLSPYYSRTRYPDALPISVTESDIRSLRTSAETIITWIMKKYSKK